MDVPMGVSVKIGRTPYRTEMMANGHVMIPDEPEEYGGGNTGPSPMITCYLPWGRVLQ